MHLSIPDTQEFHDENGSTYIGYNIHINGIFYCTVRYRQLLNLHEQLKKICGVTNLPLFPPKKILSLTGSQLDERRIALEKYLHSIGQETNHISFDLLIGYLLFAQRETIREQKQQISLEIYMANNYPIAVNVSPFDQADQVLLTVFKELKIPLQHLQYFSLFLIRNSNNGNMVVLRKLLHFESPYIAQQMQQEDNKIVIRKSYWDNKHDIELIRNAATLNILYVQTICDVENRWIFTTRETRAKLANFKANLAKRDYMELARTLKYYGYIQFLPCYCDFLKSDTKVLISIGEQELNIRIIGPDQLVKEGCFKVTRMKCWHITVVHNNNNSNQNNNDESNNSEENGSAVPTNSHYSSNSNLNGINTKLELSFEYLMAKDKLQWITITSEQAILMSVCLQSMVDELLLKRNGINNKKSTTSYTIANYNWNYMKRDGSYQSILDDNHHNSANVNSTIMNGSGNNVDSMYKKCGQFSIKRLQEKFSCVSFKTGKEFIENHAFEEIGDDDL